MELVNISDFRFGHWRQFRPCAAPLVSVLKKSLRFFKVRIFSHFLWTWRSHCCFTACCAAQTEAPRQIGHLPKCIGKGCTRSDNQGSERAGGQFCVTIVTINASHSVARWSQHVSELASQGPSCSSHRFSDQTPSEVVHRVVGTKRRQFNSQDKISVAT